MQNELLEENNSSCLLHNLLYMDVIFIFIFNLLLKYFFIFYMIYIICNSFVIILFQRTKFWEEKYIVFCNIQKYFTLDMKISIFNNYSRNMCWRCFCITLLNFFKKILKILWIYWIICVFTSHEYVVRVRTFYQSMSLIESNAHEDEWLIVIKVLQEGKLRIKKWQKRENEMIY